ncbi:MAG: ArsR/SmtB family transcription factor [Candidatus Eiseniibacteriota bacterium]
MSETSRTPRNPTRASGRKGRPGRRPGSGKRADESAPWGQRVVQALADPSRWRMVAALSSQGPLPVGTLADLVGLSSACASRHISILKEVNLIRTSRDGRRVVCGLPEASDREARLLAFLEPELFPVRKGRVNQKHVFVTTPSAESDRRRPGSAAPEFDYNASNNRPLKGSLDIDDYLL